MKVIDWIFYLLGLFLVGSFLHELYHVHYCGGEFIAGLGYIRGSSFVGGLTYCRGYAGGEVLPNIVEVLFYVLFITLKIKSR